MMGRNMKGSLPVILILLSLLSSCKDVAVPRPKGYFRISLPDKAYVSFGETELKNKLPVDFEYPVYGNLKFNLDNISQPGWFNIEFPSFKAKIHLTYRDIKGDLEELIEQTYTMNVKNHIIKADAINEQVINKDDSKIYGILYELKGNTATAVQFYVTDSIKHYLRGSLYFEAEPNADSLAPVIDFFREDIIHLIETLNWKDE